MKVKIMREEEKHREKFRTEASDLLERALEPGSTLAMIVVGLETERLGGEVPVGSISTYQVTQLTLLIAATTLLRIAGELMHAELDATEFGTEASTERLGAVLIVQQAFRFLNQLVMRQAVEAAPVKPGQLN